MLTLLQVSSASAQSILFNNTTAKIYWKNYLPVIIFAIACTSNPLIKPACLLDMVLGSFFVWRDYYENKMVWTCMPFKHIGG